MVTEFVAKRTSAQITCKLELGHIINQLTGRARVAK